MAHLISGIAIEAFPDGRIGILRPSRPGRPAEVMLTLAPAEAEWWALQLIGGALKVDKRPELVMDVWQKVVGQSEMVKPARLLVGIAPTGQIVTYVGDHLLVGLWSPAAEAVGLQTIDAVRRARGLAPAAVETWKTLAGYGKPPENAALLVSAWPACGRCGHLATEHPWNGNLAGCRFRGCRCGSYFNPALSPGAAP
jgi:hypothetical protein